MYKRIFVCAMIVLLSSGYISAQTLQLTGTYDSKTMGDLVLFAAPMSLQDHKAEKLTLRGQNFSGNITAAQHGFYNLYGATQQTQVQIPFYLQPGKKYPKLNLTFKDLCPQLNIDVNNKALSAYNLVVWNKQRDIWMKAQNITSEELRTMLQGYRTAADSILKIDKALPIVQKYIHLWADMSAYNSYMVVERYLNKDSGAPKIRFNTVYAIDEKALDTEMALYFTAGTQCIMSTISKDAHLDNMLTAITKKYQTPAIRQHMYEYIVENFVSGFNYNKNYDEGLAAVKDAVEKYQLKSDFVSTFESRKMTLSGEKFPTNVKMIDIDGKPVDFSHLKGSYVYIDIWASWCLPCRKEIPYLQKLEKELNNPLVKFVSISIDRTESDWKGAMEHLHCTGHQWLNADNSLTKVLNVKGIPFFLIYDKEGNLLKYNAMRPSDPKLKEYLEGLK